MNINKNEYWDYSQNKGTKKVLENYYNLLLITKYL